VLLRAWKMAGKSTLCCFNSYFLDFVVNVLEETSKNERTEDNFQESFHNTESEEEASDNKSSDCNNSNDNNGEDGYFRAKNFVWSKTGRSPNFRTQIHNIVLRLRGATTKEKLGKEDCTQKAWTYFCRSHVTRSSSEKERKKLHIPEEIWRKLAIFGERNRCNRTKSTDWASVP
jgi:hypothetical protein